MTSAEVEYSMRAQKSYTRTVMFIVLLAIVAMFISTSVQTSNRNHHNPARLENR